MTRKQKIQELLTRLNNLQEERLPITDYVERQLADEQTRAQTSIAVNPTGKAISRLAKEVTKLKDSKEIKSLAKRVEKLASETDERLSMLSQSTVEQIDAIQKSLSELSATDNSSMELIQQVNGLISTIANDFYNERQTTELVTKDLSGKVQSITENLSQIEQGTNKALLDTAFDVTNAIRLAEQATQKAEEATASGVSAKQAAEDMQREFAFKLSELAKRGGNANRNIAIGGNTSVLSKYTDVNLKPGANVTITYINNNATGYTDVTIASTGGPGGSTRAINTISTSQTAGDTAGTDYVYVCSAGINLTLPTASGNTNLYTVKNTSNSSVLVSTTGGETIDAQSNVILATQYTSVDLVSDSTNWNIT